PQPRTRARNQRPRLCDQRVPARGLLRLELVVTAARARPARRGRRFPAARASPPPPAPATTPAATSSLLRASAGVRVPSRVSGSSFITSPHGATRLWHSSIVTSGAIGKSLVHGDA